MGEKNREVRIVEVFVFVVRRMGQERVLLQNRYLPKWPGPTRKVIGVMNLSDKSSCSIMIGEVQE